jgi:NAD-reducing hydrogenase small subunit
MSFLDLDERLFDLIEHVTFDRSPLTDFKTFGPCDIGLVEGGLCNADNVEVLRAMRDHCRVLVAVGACAINGGLPALRNRLDVGDMLQAVYGAHVPDDPELPLPLNHVWPLHAVVTVDYALPGCPPPADAFWQLLQDLMAGRPPTLSQGLIRYD